MARLKGKTIIFKVDGTDYAGSVSNVTFDSAVGTLGFGDYSESLDYTCTVTGFQDYAATGLWMKLFDNPGASLSLIYAPHGNAAASTSQPHFTATGYAETLPTIGGQAGEFFVYDLNIILDSKPVKDVTP
jgi:hypothetical protein